MLNLLPCLRCIAYVSVLIAPMMRAQNRELLARVPAPAPQYALGPGDQVAIHVVDMDDLSDKPYRIDPSGAIDLPLVGRIEASGLSLEQLKATLAAKLARYISSPQISINLVDNQTRTVSVLGSVNSPGMRSLQGPRHLIDVLSEAGGTRPDAGSRVVITRELRWGTLPLSGAHADTSGRFTTASLPLTEVLAGSRPADNILVEPGDVISVPKEEIVYVLGNVKRAGGFPLSSRESISLLQALTLAEGLDHDAASNHAKILRTPRGNDGRHQEIPIDIGRIQQGKDADVPLFPNDILFVPNSAVRSSSRRAAEAVLQVATGVIIYRH